MMGASSLGAGVLALAWLIAEPATAQRKTPYYASITAGKARMRTGPGRNYPASWMYRRVDLPVRVVAIHESWRKVEDPDGTQGWMQSNLLSEKRTAIVKHAELPMRAEPRMGARVVWRAAPGVVGRLSECARAWCRLDVRGQAGYVERTGLWGVDVGEVIP